MTDIPVQFFKLNQIPLTWVPDSFYAIQIASDLFEFYLTTSAGQPTKAGLVRKTIEFNTGDIGVGENNIGSIETGKMFVIEKIITSTAEPFRLALYQTASQRDADEAREFDDASIRGTEHGLILDLLLDDVTGYLWNASPVAMGRNGDSPLSIESYWRVYNLNPALQSYEIQLQILVLG